MEKYKIEKTLKQMVGKMWTYRKQDHYIKNYNIGTNTVKLFCDGPLPEIIILLSDFNEVINQFFPVDTEKGMTTNNEKNAYLSTPVSHPMPIKTIIGTHGHDIVNTILRNIERVKAEPEFVPQAEAINNQVKTLIDLAKTEVEMIKAMARV